MILHSKSIAKKYIVLLPSRVSYYIKILIHTTFNLYISIMWLYGLTTLVH